MRRALKWTGSLVITGLAIAYIVWKIDIGRTAHILANATIGYFLASLAIMIVSVVPMAWRWQKLLAARGIAEGVPWLARAHYLRHIVGQGPPTSIRRGPSRVFRTARRPPR